MRISGGSLYISYNNIIICTLYVYQYIIFATSFVYGLIITIFLLISIFVKYLISL